MNQKQIDKIKSDLIDMIREQLDNKLSVDVTLNLNNTIDVDINDEVFTISIATEGDLQNEA